MKTISRRDLLFSAGGGIGGVALASLLGSDGLLAAAAPSRNAHFKPRAKAVISLFMTGGVSHVDTFDPKPALAKHHGQPLTGFGEIVVRQGYPGPLMKSPFQFRKYGQCGMEVSGLFPHVGSIADEIALIRSGWNKSNDHVLAHYEWNTGSLLMGHPSLGSWVTYGLGSENKSLPSYVVIYDPRGGPNAGVANWNNGYLPAAYQGTVFRPSGDPILDLRPPAGIRPEQQRARLDHLAALNEEHAARYPGSSELSARIASYELAYQMQSRAPEAVELAKESPATHKLYGLDDPVTEPFGRQCLLARRLVERGVRFVQLFNGAKLRTDIDDWDAHGNLFDNHSAHAREIDRPIAGLIRDLKQRGLLEDTLVIWHSEFGRMPISQKGLGRDHNPGAMSFWMAGAGIRGGQIIGETDEFGYKATRDPVSYHDLHATILHLMGLDHKRLTYYFNGRQMRLTDVHGELIRDIVG
ncbi:MAG: DUF1501 domain-containing protein [Acidobacteria bacterium]|nr:DUF1501 domain-containing protein [Acidobacteriota bacterium]